MPLWCLLIPSPRWFTSLPPRPLPQLQTPPAYSSIKSSSYMAYQNPLSPTEMPSSPASFGNQYSIPWAPNLPCQPLSTHKQMVRLNVPTEPWRTCSVPSSATAKTIGTCSFQLQNSHATMPPMHPLV